MKQNEKLISVRLRQMSVVTATALRGFPHFVVIGITNNGCFITTFLKHQSIYATP